MLILIHGYNSSKKDVLNAYQIIKTRIEKQIDAQNQHDLIIGYLWPAQNQATHYFLAKLNAHSLAQKFATHLNFFLGQWESVDILAHSMGNRLLFESLLLMPKSKKINHVFSIAAAVDNEVVEKNEKYDLAIQNHIQYLNIFYSQNDPVLKIAYLFSEFDQALGFSGAENKNKLRKNIFLHDCSLFIQDHSGYKNSAQFFKQINHLLKTQAPLNLNFSNSLNLLQLC